MIMQFCVEATFSTPEWCGTKAKFSVGFQLLFVTNSPNLFCILLKYVQCVFSIASEINYLLDNLWLND